MKLEINLDDKWVNDYEETIAEMIKFEIDDCVRKEVRKVIQGLVKESVDKFRDQLARKMRELTPAKLDQYLIKISKEGL